MGGAQPPSSIHAPLFRSDVSFFRFPSGLVSPMNGDIPPNFHGFVSLGEGRWRFSDSPIPEIFPTSNSSPPRPSLARAGGVQHRPPPGPSVVLVGPSPHSWSPTFHHTPLFLLFFALLGLCLSTDVFAEVFFSRFVWSLLWVFFFYPFQTFVSQTKIV